MAMSEQPVGSVQVERTVASIRVGNRHRADLGEIEVLAESIKRDGLLQPITVTPDGFLVCGARRLAALKLLGVKTVNVWVRSGLSDRLGQLLAEQDDNVLHKPLTPLEATALYRELNEVMAEDAARRQEASRFSATNQPGQEDSERKFRTPSEQTGRAKEQAAAMIPGGASYRTYDKIGYVEQIATNPKHPDELRTAARAELDQIQAGGPVDPAYTRIRALAEGITNEQRANAQAELQKMAEDALARVKAEKKSQKRRPHPAPADDKQPAPRLGARAFALTWTDLESWWTKYDLDQLVADLTDEQADSFYATVEGTVAFADELRIARTNQQTAEDAEVLVPR